MKHAHVVTNERLAHHESHGGAFGEGLQRHGWRVTASNDAARCDLLVMWGVRRSDWIQRQKAAGGEVCILERGYVGDRFKWTSVSFGGGLNGRGVFRGPHHDGSRWERHFWHLMKPWRDFGVALTTPKCALIMGQVAGDQSLRGVNIEGFYRTATEAYRMAGFVTRFRPHPNGGPATPLSAELAGAAVAVTWNSNSAVDAVLAGVPTVAMDAGSMAYAVTGHELGGNPPTPDRTAWAHRLAWCQWTMDEMRSGECWAAAGGEACALAS